MSQTTVAFVEKCSQTEDVETLDCAEFWTRHSAYVVRAAKLTNSPIFYPVYRWQDRYSFSPLPLLVQKGGFAPHREALEIATRKGIDVSPPAPFVDRDIERVGGPPHMTGTIRDPAGFTRRMAEAMQADISAIEAKNPGKTNVLLVGGRDSLNLALCRWNNPVVIYSAQPNTPLVRRFIEENGLDIPVHELKDSVEPALLQREIAETMLMVELEHWRWTPHIARIADDLDRQAVFWKGQVADAFLTDYWRSYTASPAQQIKFLKKIYKIAVRKAPMLGALYDTPSIASVAETFWRRAAVGQGAHLGMLRSVTDCLAVSGYHGRRTAAVWTSGHLPSLTRTDLRPAIGEALLGRPVVYPTENPSPPPSQARKGLRSPEALTSALVSLGISVAPAV